MTWPDITVSPLIAVQSPRRAQGFGCFSSNASRANLKVKTVVGNVLTWNTCHKHIPTLQQRHTELLFGRSDHAEMLSKSARGADF